MWFNLIKRAHLIKTNKIKENKKIKFRINSWIG